jgi:pimeloyl-ACP methyl ester carboxylesterase
MFGVNRSKSATQRKEFSLNCPESAAPFVIIMKRETISQRPNIMSKLIATLTTIAAMLAATTIVKATEEKPTMQTEIPKPIESGHAPVNGVNYYYAMYGKGEPLLLLHGGLFHTEMFGLTLTRLAQRRQVIGVDLQGHGRTPLGDRQISLVDMGNDMAGVLKKIGFDKVDVLGYSMGGGVALQFAVQHPEWVRRLVLVSTPFAQDGFYPEMLPQQAALGGAMAEHMKETPIYKSYAAIAPHPEDFPKLLDQMGAYMRKPYDWSADVRKLTMPVMLIYGDSDMLRPEHEVKFYQLLGGGLKDAGWQREHISQNRLAILPNLTHYEIGVAPELADTALPFLDGYGQSQTATGK